MQIKKKIPMYTSEHTYPVSDDSDNPDCALWGERTASRNKISLDISSDNGKHEVYDLLSWHRVIQYKSSNISQERVASIFMVKE
jgi:hypothetical protein